MRTAHFDEAAADNFPVQTGFHENKTKNAAQWMTQVYRDRNTIRLSNGLPPE
jgi:hypothetical protein